MERNEELRGRAMINVIDVRGYGDVHCDHEGGGLQVINSTAVQVEVRFNGDGTGIILLSGETYSSEEMSGCQIHVVSQEPVEPECSVCAGSGPVCSVCDGCGMHYCDLCGDGECYHCDGSGVEP